MGEGTLKTDMVIIGAGPVGLFSVFEAGLLGMQCHLIDNLDRPGGQCTELYPEKPIYDIPSRPRVTGQELIDDLVEQCAPFEPVFHLRQQASSLTRLDEGRWCITTSQDVRISAPVVVVAGGAGSFVPKKPPFRDLDRFEERSVCYAVHRMEHFRGERLVIVGGGDSALDWVMNLQPVAQKITLVHRRPEFRGSPDSALRVRQMAEEGLIDLAIGNVCELEGSNGQLERVRIKTREGQELQVSCDYLLPFLGLKISLGPIAHWGLNLAKNNVEVDPATFMTDTDGIFAVGDVCVYPGKLKLILTGFYEAAVMAHAAFKHACPDKKMAGGYTTTNSVLQDRLGVR
ncbi:NAD(P)/FAD-dependent oxidoreductase [Emcibacter nanhaiensis]|uniref:Ferredoxin--NADP reductase n=1 Tax=Emcibacter nanhaiensis TaxID=1505037 RepID=A0A501PBF3_9PROT|nr:NAD(P)/FAD-dependent oxidoreductase [Emcibacter nanhaiensis]TPD57565.1 NAD(P)/FAD-dependent oxidoreductase [Emcibacter nanhaiensis]